VSNDFLAKLDAEIASAEAVLTGLRRARNILAEDSPADARPSRRLLIEGPKAPPAKSKKVKRDAGDGDALNINGVDIDLTPMELKCYRRLDAMPEGECVSLDSLFDDLGSKQSVHSTVYLLKKKLAAAGATIGHVRGEGYRLENLE
jgi:DNA-binding response OmpR family regulator